MKFVAFNDILLFCTKLNFFFLFLLGNCLLRGYNPHANGYMRNWVLLGYKAQWLHKTNLDFVNANSLNNVMTPS